MEQAAPPSRRCPLYYTTPCQGFSAKSQQLPGFLWWRKWAIPRRFPRTPPPGALTCPCGKARDLVGQELVCTEPAEGLLPPPPASRYSITRPVKRPRDVDGHLIAGDDGADTCLIQLQREGGARRRRPIVSPGYPPGRFPGRTEEGPRLGVITGTPLGCSRFGWAQGSLRTPASVGRSCPQPEGPR